MSENVMTKAAALAKIEELKKYVEQIDSDKITAKDIFAGAVFEEQRSAQRIVYKTVVEVKPNEFAIIGMDDDTHGKPTSGSYFHTVSMSGRLDTDNGHLYTQEGAAAVFKRHGGSYKKSAKRWELK